MNVCVLGLWHLGTVMAACLAEGGHGVVGLDFDADAVRNLQAGRPPLYEPGLEDLVKRGLAVQRLRFTDDVQSALEGVAVVWVAYDTPVDDEDRADVEFVVERVKRIFPYLRSGMLVLISSQLPVGSTGRLEQLFTQAFPERNVSFAYSPENLRLGKAISVFTKPDRIVAGIREEREQERIVALLRPFTERIEWMSVESAEMTKHALNSFLAVSVTFANELASICEQVGADAKEVERGLKTEERIGPKAYLSPGTAFAGGTLARDIAFLNRLGAEHGVKTPLLASVKMSNDEHRQWVRKKLFTLLGPLSGKRVALWGLTYKAGTDTLRRSASIELGTWLADQGAVVTAYDPAIKTLPEGLAKSITLCDSPVSAVFRTSALVVSTEWPEFKKMKANDIVPAMERSLVIDPNRFLKTNLGDDQRVQYVAVGSYHAQEG